MIAKLRQRIVELESKLKYQRDLTARLRVAKDYQEKRRYRAERKLKSHFCDH